MIHRLINIPMCEDDFFKELNFIKQVAINYGFNSSIVTNIVKKTMYRHEITFRLRDLSF